MTITQVLVLGGCLVGAGILGAVVLGLILAHPINQHTHVLESELVTRDAAFARLAAIEQYLGFGQNPQPLALPNTQDTAWGHQPQAQWGEPEEPAQDTPSHRDLTGELVAPQPRFDATDPHQVLEAMIYELRVLEQLYSGQAGSLRFDHQHPAGQGDCFEFIIHIVLPEKYNIRLSEVMIARVQQAMQSRAFRRRHRNNS